MALSPRTTSATLATMSITLEEVRHVAKLARLDLAETEILSLQGELNALLGHFSDIQAVDDRGIETNSQAVALYNVWADDVQGPTLPRVKALANSPSSKAGLYLVPAIIED